ncbi:MAG TPA: hypothetical protein VNI60_01815 [Pyrinomonadaceae bacterium]|nr:hypothetical protein [Pyrinomonadaceae bacterium]
MILITARIRPPFNASDKLNSSQNVLIEKFNFIQFVSFLRKRHDTNPVTLKSLPRRATGARQKQDDEKFDF